jgi:hypothetical protein
MNYLSRSNAGDLSSNPIRDTSVLCVYSVFGGVLCLDGGLSTG